MSLEGFRRQFGRNQTAGAHRRQLPIGVHEGNARDFLRRHEQAATTAANGTHKQRREFAAQAFRYTVDPRNLYVAIEHLARDGDKAPGPNGLDLAQLDTHEQWNLCQELSKVLKREQYQPGPIRTVDVPKPAGGYRPIELHNAEDQVVHRALAQTIQPLLDPLLGDHVFGFRPGLGREHALIHAELLSQPDDVWILEDLQDAFGSIPHGRALDVFRMHGFNANMLDLLGRILGAHRTRGLGQGTASAPLIMNVFADHVLDRPWVRLGLHTILIRWADDLLIICRAGVDPNAAYEELHRLLLPTGMTLKGKPVTAIRYMESGMPADWLGFRVWKGGEGLKYRIGEKSWWALRDSLALATECNAPPIAAAQAVMGWMDQLGPCYQHENHRVVIRGIRECAGELGFMELPSTRDIRRGWERAYVRYRNLRRVMFVQARHGMADGFANRHSNSASTRRGGLGLTFEPQPPLSSSTDLPCVTLYTDGSCQASRGIGGWAFIRLGPEHGQRCCRTGSHPRATNNRMELTAVLRGLQSLDRPSRVLIVSDSRYVIDSIVEHLPNWKENRWRGGAHGRGRQIANVRLWQRLDAALQQHHVTCRWVPAHAGVPLNEECDRLARQAVDQHLAPHGIG